MQVVEGAVEVVGIMEDEEQEDEDSVVGHLLVLHMATTVLVVEELRLIEALPNPVEALQELSRIGRATFITHRAGAEMETSAHFGTIDSLTDRVWHAR